MFLPQIHTGDTNNLHASRYSETIDILYKDNIFKIHHLWALTDLKATTLPERFNLIRNLKVWWCMSSPHHIDDYQTKYPTVFGAIVWRAFWDVVAGMQGLRVLNVCLIRAWLPSIERLEQLLEPMRVVKQCDQFFVDIDPQLAKRELFGEVSGPFELRIIASDDPYFYLQLQPF